MKLTILGSAAAEAIPNPFCRCRVCETARREGGREVRARSAALLNEDLLFDLGPDIISAANKLNLYLDQVATVLITHRHSDHWHPRSLHWREPGFTRTPVVPLTVYGPADAVDELAPVLERATNLSYRAVQAGDQWTAGGYQITAIPATHGGGTLEPLLYVVDDGQCRVFYCTDTSSLSKEAWTLLRPLGPFDLILLDATSGVHPGDGGGGHHGFEKLLATRARMMQEGVLVPGKTTLAAHHFSHNGRLTYPELVEKYAPYNVAVSYDGCIFVAN